MKREVVVSKVIDVINRVGIIDDMNEKSDLRDDLGFDSLDAVELVIGCEDAFDIEIEDEEAETFKTVGDVVNYVCKVLKVK